MLIIISVVNLYSFATFSKWKGIIEFGNNLFKCCNKNQGVDLSPHII